ncbi:MAG TPA: DUF4846 domain-containing protein [Chitinophagaceae bacterium]|nr:DUF4846 domain-containing protein [Chitinophagaceae bacterium]
MPTYLPLLLTLLFTGISCVDTMESPGFTSNITVAEHIAENIRGIPLPPGFNYTYEGDTLYSKWLLDLKLKKNSTVYLYDQTAKADQHVQHAVLDISIGKKNLIQCADAAIKLRADYLFEKRRYHEIRFKATSGEELVFESWLKGTQWKEAKDKLISYTINKTITNSQNEFNSFLEVVFSYCGTYSLSKQLTRVHDIDLLQPGDVFVEGGFPGHAVTVMAVARNGAGEKKFLLSQGYMPAQNIHILKNYADPQRGPWYDASEIYPLHTPEWKFEIESLRRW